MTRRFGLLMVLLASASGCSLWVREPACEACHRPLHSQTSFQVTLDNGEVRKLCCPRCGLHFRAQRDGIVAMKTTDYPTGDLIPADQAFYVENSSVMLCCQLDKLTRDRSGAQYGLDWDRCLPSLVSFSKREQAEEFRSANGGTIKTMSQLESEPDFSRLITPRHP